MRNLIIAVVVIVLLVAGYFFFNQGKSTKSSNSNNTDSTSNQTSSQTADNCPNAPEATDSTTITYSSDGFSPAVVSLKSGGKLTIKNDSQTELQFDSDPHPVHTDNQDLNVGTIAVGDSQTATLTKTGCFGYHNHLQAADKGKILIK